MINEFYMIYFFVIFLVLAILFRKNRMLLLLFGLQVISAACAIIIDKQIELDTFTSYLALIYIIVCNTLIIIPWKNADGALTITTSVHKVNQLYNILTPIMLIVFVIYAIAAYIAVTHFGASMRAEEGTYSTFIYHSLPFDVHIFMLAIILYPYSYFMIPMAFFYAQNNNPRRMRICFFFSLIILLQGLTIFTRWTVALYILLFLSSFVLFHKTLPQRIAQSIKLVFFILLCIFVALLVFLSISRFADTTYGIYSASEKSLAKDPITYSVFDYLGQGNVYGHDLLMNYKGETMLGLYATADLRHLLSFAGISFVNESRVQDREDRLLGWYYDKFFCVPVYWIYDFGIIIGTLLILVYFFYIRNKIKRWMSFNDLCILSIWSQIPLMAIFYSSLSLCIQLAIMYIPISLFMKESKSEVYRKVPDVKSIV